MKDVYLQLYSLFGDIDKDFVGALERTAKFDRERAEDMNRSVNKLMQEYRGRADRVYGDIFAKLRDK